MLSRDLSTVLSLVFFVPSQNYNVSAMYFQYNMPLNNTLSFVFTKQQLTKYRRDKIQLQQCSAIFLQWLDQVVCKDTPLARLPHIQNITLRNSILIRSVLTHLLFHYIFIGVCRRCAVLVNDLWLSSRARFNHRSLRLNFFDRLSFYMHILEMRLDIKYKFQHGVIYIFLFCVELSCSFLLTLCARAPQMWCFSTLLLYLFETHKYFCLKTRPVFCLQVTYLNFLWNIPTSS